jgi:hypothetical protein
MNYSLGNMLSRGGALNPDGLALDLQFAADKTLTARKGPTPTFTRASTSTFVGSNGLIQTAAINAPRFDHDPVTLASRGLLIEESRTNFAPNSQNLSSWSFSNATLGSATTAPDGSNTANAVSFQSSTSSPQFYSFVATLGMFTVTAGQQYTVSFYVKAATNTLINIYINGRSSALNNIGVQVNVTTSWTRVTFTATASANDSGLFAVIGTGVITFAANPPSVLSARTIEIWGAQLELGSFPTSYIPTTTASVVRSADVCSITTAGWSNAGNDTMIAEYFIRNTPPANTTILEGSPAVSWMTLALTGASGQRNLYRHGATNTRFDGITVDNSISLTSINKTALTSGEQLALNGSLNQTVLIDPGQSDISTSLSIGSRGNGNTLFLNGNIASIRYYKKRLPNAKLQSLTT